MIPCTTDGLLKFLKVQKLNPTLQNETQQVFVVFKLDGQEFPLFFRIYEGEELLQMLIFFPLQLRPERLNAMARLLHFLNKEVDLPGFGMDESVGLVFHRTMIPVFNKKIDTALMESCLEAVPKICKQFFPSISGTAISNLTFEEILKKIKK